MSIIAQRWAYSQKLGNPTAKAILAFLASHNFGGDQSCFRIKTIGAALDLGETAVKNGLVFLAEKGLLKKEARYGERGERLANEYTLNIPKEYADSCYAKYGDATKNIQPVDNHGGVGRQTPGGGSPGDGGVGRQTPTLNNKLLNNNINKSSYMKSDQKANNEKKHAWSDKPKSPFSDPTKQSTSYKPPTEEIKVDTSTANYQAFIQSNPALRRKYKLQDAGM